MKPFPVLVLCLGLGPAAQPASARLRAEAPPAGLERLDFAWAGVSHEVWLAKPAGAGPHPLVLALHGGGGTALGMVRLTGFDALARREGFLAVFPDSGVKAWNDGRTDFQGEAAGHDDSGWLAALAGRLAADGLADGARLYVCGISNGGFMTTRLACEHADLFAAAGVVSATFSATYRPPDGAPIPLCYVMGEADPIVPFAGGSIRLFRIGRSRGRVESLESALAFWKARNRCGAASEYRLDPLDAGDPTRIRVRRYQADPGAAPLQAYIVEGGGHTWPGGWAYLGPALVGRTSRNLDASRALWDFFKAQRLAGASVGALGNPRAFGQAYHATSDEHTDWNGVFVGRARAAGAPAPRLAHVPSAWLYRQAPRRSVGVRYIYRHPSVFDNAKAARDLGFATRVPLVETCRRQIAWMEAEGRLRRAEAAAAQTELVAAHAEGRDAVPGRFQDWNPWGNGTTG